MVNPNVQFIFAGAMGGGLIVTIGSAIAAEGNPRKTADYLIRDRKVPMLGPNLWAGMVFGGAVSAIQLTGMRIFSLDTWISVLGRDPTRVISDSRVSASPQG